MDGANVEMAEEVGKENMFIFGMSSDEVIAHEQNRDYNPMDIFNQDQEIRQVLMQLINGFYSGNDTELFRDLYNSLLNTQCTQFAPEPLRKNLPEYSFCSALTPCSSYILKRLFSIVIL